jgi:putative FmdB family regulatory protein
VPIYEYRCRTCGDSFEKLMRRGSDEQPACPSCGQADTDRLISAIARLSRECGPGAST